MGNWVIANDGDAAVNLDNCTRAEINTGGVVRFYYTTGSSEGYLTVDFGSTDQEARDGIVKVTQALDPSIYI